MRVRWWLALALVALILAPTAASPAEPVRVKDLKDNVQAVLVSAERVGRGGNLFATFQTQDEARKEIKVVFPAHSFTTHERTLMQVIEGCLDERGRVKPGVEAVFSIPSQGASFEGSGTGS